jgi:tetratricopeptide (TPR) repeat protein
MMHDLERAALASGEVQHLNGAGLTLLHSGDLEKAVETFRRGLALLPDLPRGSIANAAEAALSGNLAQALYRQGHIQDAIRLLERQITLALQLGDQKSLANALNVLAQCYFQQGKEQEAEHLFEKYLALARKLNDKRAEGNALNNLSNIYIKNKQYGPAIALLRQRIALARSIEDGRGEASSLLNLAGALRATSDVAQAKSVLGQAVNLMRRIGDPRLAEAEAELAQF